MYEEDMEADEDGTTAAAAAGRSRASPRQKPRLLSDSRRGRGSILSQTVPVQRRGGAASKGGVALGVASTYHAGGIAAGGGGGGGGGSSGGSFRSGTREDYLRKILQSRHPFPPHFHILLFIDRSYLYYCPSTGERMVLPVDVFGPRARPPPFKQLRVHPDGGMGPIPLYTGWTLGPVPRHVAAWAQAAKRTSADLEHQRSGGEGGAGEG
ncbi:unnamed protein product, partial [Ectocarpus sp. 8 AP-2014]